MKRRARYICFEGIEGVGKTTQVAKLVSYLQSKGYSVFSSKEPGCSHSDLTLELRKIMLDATYDNHLTMGARELISQSIRSIHIEKIIKPALSQFDFVIQDRGIMSGVAYGAACGNNLKWLTDLSSHVCQDAGFSGIKIYDDIVYLMGDPVKGLDRAQSSKKEFAAGDAIEMKGKEFMHSVRFHMDNAATWFNAKRIDVEDNSIDEVFNKILSALNLRF